MRRVSFTLVVIVSFLAVRSNAFGQRVLESTQFHIEWSDTDPSDPERIDVLQWKGGPNLTLSFPGSSGCNRLDVEYFGNAWAPPDPGQGGIVLVGAGTQGSWTAAEDGLSTVIKSTSRGCQKPFKVHVRTKYTLYNVADSGYAEDHIRVERTFGFGTEAFPHDVRPYIPRLYPFDQFTQVLHPDATHNVLVTEDASQCAGGCQLSDWDGTWFAIHDPNDFRGVIVHRRASPFAVNLWVDFDGGSWSNASSVLALQPAGGFTGLVTEVEKLCFYDASNWSQKKQTLLNLPLGCRLPPK